MMKITTVTTVDQGMYDPDIPPVVYHGHLGDSQIDKIAREYGGIDTDKGGYADYAVTPITEGSDFFVEYSNKENADRSDMGGITEEDSGDMVLYIRYDELTVKPE